MIFGRTAVPPDTREPQMSDATEIDVDGVPVRITNRDKPFFPKLGPGGPKAR